MAKRRMIDTRFWSDSFVVELNPLDRYLFLYLLTNEHTNICGIYELPLKRMADETGIEKDMLLRMFKRLKGKVAYVDGWVILKNFAKHQSDNESVKKGITNALKIVPPYILRELDKIEEVYQNKDRTIQFPKKQLSSSVRDRILKRDNNTCQVCSFRGEDDELDIDHIKPRFMGGGDEEENLRVLCKKCNLRRDYSEYKTQPDTLSDRLTPPDISEPELEPESKLESEFEKESVASSAIPEIIKLFEPINPNYEEWYRNKTQRLAVSWLIDKVGREKLERLIKALPSITSQKTAPRITSPHELKRDWAKLGIFINQQKSTKKEILI